MYYRDINFDKLSLSMHINYNELKQGSYSYLWNFDFETIKDCMRLAHGLALMTVYGAEYPYKTKDWLVVLYNDNVKYFLNEDTNFHFD